MNRHTRTFSAVALALGTLPAAGLVHAVDNPPTTPATISANRYSTTGAGILWARSTDAEGAVRGYEVFRDGVSLGIRDALSVTERGLVPGRSYSYSVAAVDAAGQRSAPIRVTLNAAGVSSATGATGTVPPTAGAPAAPASLRATAYSGTAGAIAWARPAASGLRYEVRRDGALLGTTDGLSYVDNALSPGRDFRYEVVAIDASGRRSAAASVTLRTQGTATASNPFTPVTPTTPTAPTAPATPSGLRTVAYSGTAGAVVWARPAAVVPSYEVRRDGVLLSTTNTLSYIDEGLSPGRDYRYEIVAIDSAGRRSAPASVTLRTQGGAAGSTPTVPTTPSPTAGGLPSDVAARLEAIFDIANGDAIETAVALGRKLGTISTEGLTAGFDQKRRASNADGTRSTTLSCPGGGRFDVVEPGPSRVVRDPIYIGRDCRIGQIAFDGFIENIQLPEETTFQRRELGTLMQLQLTDDRVGTVTTLVNAGAYSGAPDTDSDLVAPFGYSSLVTALSGDGGNVTLSSAGEGARNYTVLGGSITSAVPGFEGDTRVSALLQTEFEARLVDDAAITKVRTSDAFGGLDARGNFTSGRLDITGTSVAGGAFEYVLDAGNGDPASFQLDVTRDGSTTSYTVPWSASLRFDAFEPEKVDLGF